MHRRQPGVAPLRTIVARLDFDCTAAQAALFEHLVQDDPRLARLVLETYAQTRRFLLAPLINAVERGLLRTPQLSPRARLEWFGQFLEAKRTLGYRNKLAPRTAAMFGEVALRAQKPGLDALPAWGLDQGVPLRVVKNWAKRIR